MKIYQSVHQEITYDSLDDTNAQALDNLNNIMPPKMAQLLQSLYMKELDQDRNKTEGVLCKSCYTAMVKMVSKFGKFDKEVKF